MYLLGEQSDRLVEAERLNARSEDLAAMNDSAGEETVRSAREEMARPAREERWSVLCARRDGLFCRAEEIILSAHSSKSSFLE